MDSVIMREVPSSSSWLSLLQRGAIDIAQYLQPRECIALINSTVATFNAVGESSMVWLELNATIKPFDNVDVRRAMNVVIPRRACRLAGIPLGRFGHAAEIAPTAFLLAGPGGSFYVGATMNLNRGEVMV